MNEIQGVTWLLESLVVKRTPLDYLTVQMSFLIYMIAFCRSALAVRCVWHGLPFTRPGSHQCAEFTRAECRPQGPSAPGAGGAVQPYPFARASASCHNKFTGFKRAHTLFWNLQMNLFTRVIKLELPCLTDMQCNCMMGVFPEISRAWLTIDNDIFMWNYEDGWVLE